jgi:ABC-type polysaccharide/polyol phosphate export permease
MTLVSKVYFPREALPLSAVFTQTFDTLIGSVILLILLPIFGLPVTVQWLWVVPLGLLLFLFTTGLCLFLSCANLFFRDVKYLVQVAVMFGIFLTPVFYEPIMLGALGSKLILLNPLTPIVEGLRLAVVEGHNLLEPLTRVGANGVLIWEWSPWYLALSTAWGVLGLLGSALLFHRSEFLFAEYV